MKYYIVIAFAFLALTSCNKQKIAFVDNGRVINEIQEKKGLRGKIQNQGRCF